MVSPGHPKGHPKSPKVGRGAPRGPSGEAFAPRPRKRRSPDPPRDPPIWLPYSNCHGFHTFHRRPPGHLFDRFRPPFGTLCEALDATVAPRGHQRGVPKNTLKKTPQKSPPVTQNASQKPLSKSNFWHFLVVPVPFWTAVAHFSLKTSILEVPEAKKTIC